MNNSISLMELIFFKHFQQKKVFENFFVINKLHFHVLNILFVIIRNLHSIYLIASFQPLFVYDFCSVLKIECIFITLLQWYR